MKCPSCDEDMKIRNGVYGEFYFCPMQSTCGQKTITKQSSFSYRSGGLVRTRRSSINPPRTSLYVSCESSVAFDHITRPYDPDLDDEMYDDGQYGECY